MFSEYDVVILDRDIPEHNLKKGILGTIVMVYNEPNKPIGYEVEFVDENLNTTAILTVYEHDIKIKK